MHPFPLCNASGGNSILGSMSVFLWPNRNMEHKLLPQQDPKHERDNEMWVEGIVPASSNFSFQRTFNVDKSTDAGLGSGKGYWGWVLVERLTPEGLLQDAYQTLLGFLR